MYTLDNIKPVDLATNSFGQNYNCTMIQMVSAFSSLINGGNYYKPHVVTKITDTDKQGEFSCTGGIEVSGVRIKCWRYYRPHGSESLRKALMNSCNPVFIA